MTSVLSPDDLTPLTREQIAAEDSAILHRAMTVDVRELNDAGTEPGTLAIALSSETPVVRWGYDAERGYYQFREVLSHERGAVDLSYAADGLPFCRDHDIDEQIGLVANVRVDADKRIRGEVIEGNHPDAAWLFKDMRRGIRKKVSIGYLRGGAYTETPDENGGMPTRVYRDWMLYECSTVTVPADYAVGVGRSDARGVAASITHPATPAPAGEETRMEKQNDGGAALATAPAAPAESREAVIARIARDHDAHLGTNARLADWITNSATIEQVREQVNAMYRDKNASITPGARPAIEVGADREAQKSFSSFVEQLVAIKNAASGTVDKRLLELNRAAPTGLGEQVGADGGYLIAPQFAQNIFRIVYEQGEVIRRVNEIPVAGNQYVIPAVDETARTNGNRFGGVRVFRAGENDTAASSRPKFRRVVLDVTKKLIGVGYATEEQLEDAPATSSIMEQAFAEEITFTKEREIFEGNGVSEMLGFLNSGALITQTAEGGQTAGTINAANVLKMRSRLIPRARREAVWFINQDAEPQLPLMTIGQQPVYLPPGGLSGAQYGTMFGMPVVPVEYCSTLGQVGDLVLANLSYYAMGTKGGSRMQRSIHVRFVQGEETFRIVDRCDGQPMLTQPITPLKGTNTQSAFVALAAR